MGKQGRIEIGDRVPAFRLQDQHRKWIDIKDYIGKKKLVIYFYPKDETAVCTKEACAFRDSYQYFKDAGAEVIGINSGSVQSHLSFAQNHNLNFTLLSDPDNKVLQQFGIKNVLFVTGRETFVVDERGIVRFKYRSMLNGNAHVEETLKFLKAGR